MTRFRALAALLGWMVACASSDRSTFLLVEVTTEIPIATSFDRSGTYSLTVDRDGSVTRKVHRWDAGTRVDSAGKLTPVQLAELSDLLAAPVIAEQKSAPVDSPEFTITSHASPPWSATCYETTVNFCVEPFRRVWKKLQEILGLFPGPDAA